jgi:hypothetical protein
MIQASYELESWNMMEALREGLSHTDPVVGDIQLGALRGWAAELPTSA